MPSGKGYEIIFNGTSSVDIPGFMCHRVVRSMFGKNRDVLREVPGREGAWLFGEKRGLRKLVIEASVLAPSFPIPRRDALVAVADWLDTDNFAPLIISDHPDRYYMAKLDSEPDIDEWRHKGSFSVSMVTEPYAYDLDPSEYTAELTPSDGADSFDIDDAINAYPIIEITARGGSLNGFALTVNGYVLRYTSAVPENATINISSLSYTLTQGASTDVYLTGAFNPASISMGDVSGEFPVLLAGQTQNVSLQFGSGSSASAAELIVSWRRRYR